MRSLDEWMGERHFRVAREFGEQFVVTGGAGASTVHGVHESGLTLPIGTSDADLPRFAVEDVCVRRGWSGGALVSGG